MKFDSHKLTERITFCLEVNKRVNGMPAKSQVEDLYDCYACVQDARESDTQTSLNTGTKLIKTFIIRDPRGDYKPSNKHYILFDEQRYNIVYVKPDYQDKSYLRIYCEVTM